MSPLGASKHNGDAVTQTNSTKITQIGNMLWVRRFPSIYFSAPCFAYNQSSVRQDSEAARHLALRGKKGAFVIPEDHQVWHPSMEAARALFELGTRIVEAAENNAEIFNDSRWARYGLHLESRRAPSSTLRQNSG
jgi:hypothetical protein